MKKPLLLLVDDDRAVLEALEAELAPAFGEICRIEAFDDPREVLASLPRWTEEQRPIAVAVVDQKMPHLTGVELLAALRRSVGESADDPATTEARASAPAAPATPPCHPAAHLRAVLLTGYAGLDSALAAKNEAGVDRYLEKPWEAAGLARAVRDCLSDHLTQTGADRHILWRALTEPDDLYRHLQLRYEVYADHPYLRNVLPADTDGVDVDEYDARSWHFGLFVIDGVGREMVGTHRHVPAQPAPLQEVFVRLAERLGLSRYVQQAPAHSIPTLGYWPEPQPLQAFVNQALDASEHLTETTRATVTERAHRVLGGPEAFMHLMESATAQSSLVRRDDIVMTTCAPTHAAAYRRLLGMRLVPGTQGIPVPGLGEGTHYVLYGRAESLPAPMRRRCESLATRIARTGAACRCATFPDCLGGPYESGDFLGTDLFCPLRACEALAETTAAATYPPPENPPASRTPGTVRGRALGVVPPHEAAPREDGAMGEPA